MNNSWSDQLTLLATTREKDNFLRSTFYNIAFAVTWSTHLTYRRNYDALKYFFDARNTPLHPFSAPKMDIYVSMSTSKNKSLAKGTLAALNHIMRINGKKPFPSSWIKTKPARGVYRRLMRAPKQAIPFTVQFAIQAYRALVTNPLQRGTIIEKHWLHLASIVIIMTATWARYNCMTHFNLRLTLATEVRAAPAFFAVFDHRKFRYHQCRVPLKVGLTTYNPLVVLKRWRNSFDMNRAPGIRKHVFLRKVCFRSQPPRVLNELMPCQQLTKCIRMIARRINLPCPEIFTSHSPRVGGNSSAAAAGIPIEIRQHFGMWSQRSSAQSYDAMIDDRATATSSPFSG